MFVCISKGNEVLKDIVAVELQGFVWLLIYHFMFLNVLSLQHHSHQFVFIFIEPFSTPFAVIKHLAQVLSKKNCLLCLFCVSWQTKSMILSRLKGDIGCSHYYLDDLAVGDRCFIWTCRIIELYNQSRTVLDSIWWHLSIQATAVHRIVDYIRISKPKKPMLLWIVIQSLNLLASFRIYY